MGRCLSGLVGKNLEVEIFPARLLSSKTTRNIVRRLSSIPGVINVYVDSMNYYDGSDSVTKCLIVQINEPSSVNKIDKVCRKILSIGYSIRTGKFTKPQPTISDYLREKTAKRLDAHSRRKD